MQLAKQELDVGLVTRNVEAQKRFYGEVMGFTTLPAQPLGELGTQWRFRTGNHLVKVNDFAQTPEENAGGTGKANGIRLLAFILDDLDGVLTRLDAAGIRHSAMPVPEQTPFRVAFSSDADGNALELVGLRRPAGDKLTTRMQIGLTVSSIERSKHFYGEVLGFAQEPEMKLPKSMGVVGNVRYGFVAGKTTIKFWHMGELPTKTGGPGRRTGIRMITAIVDDLDATHEHLRQQDVAIKAPPHDLQGLARVMFAADPDGNWIEFVQAAKS
jgi:catechol 2,3-dioxygenase-like lactoylglutathione lyase family enzyme